MKIIHLYKAVITGGDGDGGWRTKPDWQMFKAYERKEKKKDGVGGTKALQ